MSADGFDQIDDPLERLERNERQGLQAFRYVLLSGAAIAALSIAIVALADVTGPQCAEPDTLCTTASRVWLVVLPTLLALGLSVLSAVKTYRRWQRHIRWRPWLFATYAMWMLTTAYLLLSSSAVFVQVG